MTLPRRKGLRSTAAPARRRGLPAISAKRKAMMPARRELTARMIAAVEGRCQIRIDGVCTGAAQALHEIKTRARGGSILDEANCVPACNRCNGWCSDNPLEAHAKGFLKWSWED